MEKIDPSQIKEKIRQAEESVADMQDETLKKVAFETVLSAILAGSHGSAPSTKKSVARKPIKKRPATSRTANQSRQSQDRKTTLQLDPKQLKELKEFFDQHAPKGTEEVVFTLAYFVHEKLKLQKFHIGDIHYVYQNLLPLKPSTKPPAMAQDQIKRAVRWLIAPSRKKQWLKDIGDGMLEISSQGMLRMTYDEKSESVRAKRN